jgi:cytochrome oxidase Cu insertion factor (SCO1/SenC/PrrC family)
MRAIEAVASIDPFAEVDALRASRDVDALVGLLAEQSPVYAGRGSSEAERLRGYILASFETSQLPAAALPYVVEELEIGLNSYVVAAAAKALRGAHDRPGQVAKLLLDAIDRIRSSDDVVCFDRSADAWTAEPPTTALIELFRTLAWLGSHGREAEAELKAMLAQRPPGFSTQVRAEIEKALAAISLRDSPAQAHCCGGRPAPIALKQAAEASPVGLDIQDVGCDIRDVGFDIQATQLQDQDGAIFSFGDFFLGRPGVLAFFYTRCMNPNKCSLTITKLARLQKRFAKQALQGSFNVAAITYDPAFDSPSRLRAYGADRGLVFDDRNRLLRTTGTFEPLQRWLDLGVGYGATTVNQHRLDIVVLDDKACPATQISRVQWDEDEIISALKTASRKDGVGR